MDRPVPPARKRLPAFDGAIFILLGLKLILLAFFILLATLSRFEEQRSRAVMESVTTAFRGHVTAVETRPVPDAGLGQLEGAPSLSDRIETLFKQSIPLVEVEASADGRVLRLEAPSTSLFAPGSEQFAPGRGALLLRLASALREGEGARRFQDLRFLHATPEGRSVGSGDPPVLRAGKVVRRLSELGLGEASLSAGLWPVVPDGSHEGRIAFEIRLDPEAAAAESGAGDGGAR